MSESAPLRFAPASEGVQTASAWRVWVQGDEFYAAPRASAAIGKISFHRNQRWQYTIGSTVRRLARPLLLSDGWLHACELAFLISPGLFLPQEKREKKVIQVEVPTGHKLVVNLLQSSDASRPHLTAPPEIGGSRLMGSRLRSGNSLLVTSCVLPMNDNDRSIVADLHSKLRIQFEQQPKLESFYAEATWQSFSQQKGNVLVIVPAGPDTVAVNRDCSKSAT